MALSWATIRANDPARIASLVEKKRAFAREMQGTFAQKSAQEEEMQGTFAQQTGATAEAASKLAQIEAPGRAAAAAYSKQSTRLVKGQAKEQEFDLGLIQEAITRRGEGAEPINIPNLLATARGDSVAATPVAELPLSDKKSAAELMGPPKSKRFGKKKFDIFAAFDVNP